MSLRNKNTRHLFAATALAAIALAQPAPSLAQRPSKVDPLRSVATALVKPNALLVLDLSASMQCDLQAEFWPANSERAFGSTDKRTCVDQSGLPTGVRTGEFFDETNATVLANPTLPDDFFSAKWTLEYNSAIGPDGGGGGGGPAPPATCALGASFLAFNKNKLEWTVTNGLDTGRLVERIKLNFPAVNRRLKKVKIGGDEVENRVYNAPVANIPKRGRWRRSWNGEKQANGRKFGAGESKVVRFQFVFANTEPDNYQFDVVFDDGCVAYYPPVIVTPPPPEPGGGGEEACINDPDSSGECAGTPCLLCQAGGALDTGAFRWRWHDASRLAIVKNLLGDSVSLDTVNQPLTDLELPTEWVAANACVENPPTPLETIHRAPQGLITANADKINFGLGVFSCLSCHNHPLGDYANELEGKDPKPSCKMKDDVAFADACGFVADEFPDPDSPLQGKGPTYKTMVRINTNDLDYAGQDTVRDSINAYLNATYNVTAVTQPDGSTVDIAGPASYTATPTPCAIRCARFEFEFEVFPGDEKLGICQRRNYMILITDGQSTEVGAGHNTKSCGDLMPWDMADELFRNTRTITSGLGDAEGAVRTFVIGISTQTTQGSARDELNQIAFHGRTDSSQPKGGVDIAGDDGHWSVWDQSKNYAYFATNATELAQALRDVITSISAVDLATAPPVASKAGTISTFDGNRVGLLASSQFPQAFGHLRLFNFGLEPTDPDYEVWDAGEKLNERDLVTNPRALYTSDPNSIPPNELVKLSSDEVASVEALKVLMGLGSLDLAASIIDFATGLPVNEIPGDESSPAHERPWRLGDIINSTPAVRSNPPRYTRFGSHNGFNSTYSGRHPLVFIGGSDLMLHAHDIVDGEEQFAYIPPVLLPKLLQQYQQWIADGYNYMGQPFDSTEHIYGIASSPRLADIQDSSDQWLTALISGLGPGGSALFALDVTSSYGGRTIDGETYAADPNHDANAPFKVLWTVDSTDTGFENLGETWSVPAVGYGQDDVGDSLWLAAAGSAYGAGDQGKFVYLLDAFTGELVRQTGSTALDDRAGMLVTDNYYFADTVGYSSTSLDIDAPLNTEIQADLAGRLWATRVDDSEHGHSVLYDAGAAQPIYFSPAVSTYRQAGPFTLAAYASGSFDETDAKINGSTAVLDAHLFLSVSEEGSADSQTVGIDVTDETLLTRPDGTAFSDNTRPVSSPLTIVPAAGTPRTLYTLFDPTPTDGNCFGRSYIVAVDSSPQPPDGTTVEIQTYEVGAGKVSGFAVGEGTVVVGQSGTGGAKATILPVENTDLLPAGGGFEVLNWRELF